MAALPKSRSGGGAPPESTDSIRSPRTVTVPPGRGGPDTGNTQRAERVCSSAGPGIAGLVLLQRFNRGNEARVHHVIQGIAAERVVRSDAIHLVVQPFHRGPQAAGVERLRAFGPRANEQLKADRWGVVPHVIGGERLGPAHP